MSDVAAPPRHRPLARLGGAASGLGSIVAMLALVALVTALAIGYQPLAVQTGSMSPTIEAGDLALCRSVDAGQVQPGQVIAFHDHAISAETITHRLVSVQAGASEYVMTTRGDANLTSETWTVDRGAHLGRCDAVVPQLGLVLLHRLRWALLATIAVLTVLAVSWTRRWLNRSDKDDDEPAFQPRKPAHAALT